MDRQTAKFLDEAIQKGADPVTLLRNPPRAAQQLGLKMSDRVAKNLKRFAPAVRKMDAADAEALRFFNRVVVDGRFINQFASAPAEVARNLKIKLSRAAQNRLKQYKLAEVVGIRSPGTVMSPYAVAVVVAAIIVLWSNDPRRVIVDTSGRVKL
jgi:hypothetical protein